MAKQTINIGTNANSRDGDPLRNAFRKINDNFDELYAGQNTDPSNTAADLIPDADGTRSLGSEDKRWEDVYVKDFIYLNQNRIELTANGTLLINGGPPAERQDTTGSVFADDSSVMVDGIAGKIVGPVDTTTVDANTITATSISGDLTGNVTGNVTGNITGDIVGSVFADDSTSMVDSVGKAINLDGTVKGNIIPDANEAYDIGSMTHKFRDLYLSGSTINLGGIEITNDGGVITFGGEKVVVEGGTGDVKGSVFGDDSTLLVDAVNSIIPKAVVQDSTNWDTAYSWGDHAAAGYLVQADILDGTLTIDVNNTGDLQGSVFGDDSTLLVDAINSVIPKAVVEDSANWDTAYSWGDHSAAGYQSATAPFTGDVKGSVFGDDSTLLIDATNNIIPKANIEDSANWDTAYGWGDHSAAGYAPQATTYTKAEVDTAISEPRDIKGSVFADDSTLLVDGAGGTIAGPISSQNWMAAYDGYVTISNGGNTTPGPIQIVASANLDLTSGTNNDINITPHGSGRVKVSDGAFGIVEAATFIGHADQTMYLSSKTTGTESTHITLNSTSGVQTAMYGDVTMEGSFTPPMLTQAEVDALTPTLGMMIYNTTTGKFQGYAADANNDSTTGWADLH